ncbi:S1 family peptidase [Streptomyces sp. M19]
MVDDSAADTVRAAGAEPRLVEHSLAQLDAARATLKERATVAGTAWSMDPKTNKIVVTLDRTVKGDALAKVNKAVDSLGDKVSVRHTAGEFKTRVAGGDAIWGSGARCSLGFNVVRTARRTS